MERTNSPEFSIRCKLADTHFIPAPFWLFRELDRRRRSLKIAFNVSPIHDWEYFIPTGLARESGDMGVSEKRY